MSERSEGAQVRGSLSNRVSAKWDGAPTRGKGMTPRTNTKAFIFGVPRDAESDAKFVAEIAQIKAAERAAVVSYPSTEGET